MSAKNCQGCLMDHVSGKWKFELLYNLKSGAVRMSELERLIPDANPRVLTRQLRALEKDGIVQRKIYAEVPQRVEYSLTDYGKALMKLMKLINQFTVEHMDLLKKNDRLPEPCVL